MSDIFEDNISLENFPSLQKVKDAILKLKKEGFPVYSGDTDIKTFVKKIKDILASEFGIFINTLQPFKHKEFVLNIFRARELDSFTEINLIREHSYPPLDKVGMGRCNFPKHPVFYCSNDAMTALIEVARSASNYEKRYCISKWKLMSPDDDLIFQNFMQSPLPPENHFNFYQSELERRINEPFELSLKTGLDEDRKQALIEYLKFLDSSFIFDNNYSLSASLAYLSLYANHNYRADILMYPSFQTNSKGVNLALSPNFVDNNLRLVRLYEVSLEKYNPKNGKINVTFYRYADVKKNMIWWNKITQEDNHYEKILKEDFGHLLKQNSTMSFQELK